MNALTNSATTGSFDNLTGTSNNDTFTAGPGTAETGDVINGGAGTDVFNIQATADVSILPTVSNVEQVYVTALGADVDVTVGQTNATGISQLWAKNIDSNGSAANDASVTFTGVTTSQTMGVEGGTSTAADRGDAIFTLTGVSGSADEASMALKGASVQNVTANGLETLNIATSGGASRIDGTLNSTSAAAVKITGSSNLRVDATDFANDGYEVDASAFQGSLNITLEDQASGSTKVTGGSGDDHIFLGNGLDANDSIDGGAGTNSISVTVDTDLTAATGALLKNFQVFDAAGAAAGTYDMDFIDGGASSSTIQNVEVTAALTGAVVIDDLVDTGGVTINASTGAFSLTVNQAGAEEAGSNSDSMTYTLTSPSTTGNLTVNSLVTPDVETINIVSNATDGQTTGHTITATTFAAATTVKFSGDEQLTVTTLGAAAATNIDASAMTDKFIMTNASDAATTVLLQGGSAGDTLEIAEGTQLTGSVVQGNAGGDLITISGNAAAKVTTVKIAAQGDSTASAYDELVGFENADATDGAVTSADLINISAFGFTGAQAGVVDATAKVTMTGTQVGGTESFTISAANAANFFDDSSVDRGVAYADSGTDTWLFFDVDKNGNWDAATDSVLIVGAVSDAFAAADFTFI